MATLPRRLYNHVAGVVFLFVVVSLMIHYGSKHGIETHMDPVALPTATNPSKLPGDIVPAVPLCTCGTGAQEPITKTITVEKVLTSTVTAQEVITQTVTVTATPGIEGVSNAGGWHRAYDEDYQSRLTDTDKLLVEKLRGYTRKSDPATSVFDGALHARQKLFTDLYSIGSPSGPASWNQYLDSLPPQYLPPLTHITQHYIYSHQHPTVEECKKAKFLVIPSFRRGSGLGSIFHGATHALSVAIRSGRVLIYDERIGDGFGVGVPGGLFAGTGEGCPDSKLGVNCFFEPITNCSWSDVRLEGSDDGDEPNAILYHPYNVQAYESIKHPTLGYFTRFGDLPPVVGLLLQEWEGLASGGTGVLMSPNARKLWWRGQAVGYLARINPWAMQQLKDMRLGKMKRVGIRGNQTDLPIPFPLPHHSISIHVRHGDKSSEMALVPFSNYMYAATKIADENPSRGMVSKTIFLSTEDPLVIDEMYSIAAAEVGKNDRPTTSNFQWTFFYSEGIPRRNGGPKEEVASGEEVETTLMHLGELMISLESGTWVGTRASNWCRLVDELAQVWVGGAGVGGGSPGVFLEVGSDRDWLDYHF